MDFLGFYNIFMALAFAGACGGAYNCDDGADYGPDSAYVADDGGASTLPPAYAIINRPPTQVDNGYNPAFYWNRPHDEDNEYAAADYSYGYRYSNYPNYPAYPSYTGSYPAYADNAPAPDVGYAEVTGGHYDAEGGDYDTGYYVRPYRMDHERHSPMERSDRDHSGATMSRDMPADRYDADRDMHPVSAGYNGHDRHMFDGDRQAKNKSDSRPHQHE